MDHETLPPCPRADCDAYPEDAPHHFHNWWGDTLTHQGRNSACITGGPGLSSRCYSAHVPNVSESPTGSPTAGFVPVAERDALRARLDAVLAMHEINPCDHGSEPHAPILFAFGERCYGPWCRGCGARYPCRTRRAAEGVE